MASASSRGGGIKRQGTSLIVEAASAHSATVILMHGLGDSASGWIDTAASALSPALPHVKFILPTAEERPVTINGGMLMNAWYDIKSLSSHRELETCAGIGASRTTINRLMEAETSKGIAPERIVLAGFSQGGALALYVGLKQPATLAGIVVLSGYMPLPDDLKGASAETLATPVLQCHGDRDGVVPLAYGKDAHDRLVALGAKNAAWKVYPGMAHSASDDELGDVIDFLRRVLPSAAP